MVCWKASPGPQRAAPIPLAGPCPVWPLARPENSRATLCQHAPGATAGADMIGVVAESGVARKLLAQLRQTPKATPAEALAEFRRQLVELDLKANRR